MTQLDMDVLNSSATLGTNQSGMRAYNEKLVLTLLRNHGAMAKADIAKITGLSAQTVSVIMREMEEGGLITKGKPIRGRIGQPSVPMSLNPDGANFLGLKIGRRTADLILIDFLGDIRATASIAYKFPSAEEIIDFTERAAATIREEVDPSVWDRIYGMGVAIPFEIWDWANIINVDPNLMRSWQSIDIATELAQHFDFPIYIRNDMSAACGAELTFGKAETPPNFLYFYIGYFIGGGIVLNGKLFTGARGNSGAVGSTPVVDDNNERIQLIEMSSISVLDKELAAQNLPSGFLWDQPDNWDVPEPILQAWISKAARGLAQAAVSASSVIDFEAVLVDGWFPSDVRRRITEALKDEYVLLNHSGLSPMHIMEGTVGANARALGAASIPLTERFMVD